MSDSTDGTQGPFEPNQPPRPPKRAHLELIRTDAPLPAGTFEEASEPVLDLNAAARQKQDLEIRRLRATNSALINLARDNLATQSQVHAAILAMLEAESLTALDRKLSGRIAKTLNVDALRVFIEGHRPIEKALTIFAAAPGLSDSLLGQQPERLGHVDSRFADALYGGQGHSFKSEALVRLDIAGRAGLLCLASLHEDSYTPDMAPDFLHFFARALERRMTPWLRDGQ